MRRQLGFGGGQCGTRLQDLDLDAVLLEDGQRVAGLDPTADVDHDALEAAGALGHHAHLFARADVAAVRQALLDVAALCDLGRHRRGRRRGLGDRRSRRLCRLGHAAAGGEEQGAGERDADQQGFRKMHGIHGWEPPGWWPLAAAVAVEWKEKWT